MSAGSSTCSSAGPVLLHELRRAGRCRRDGQGASTIGNQRFDAPSRMALDLLIAAVARRSRAGAAGAPGSAACSAFPRRRRPRPAAMRLSQVSQLHLQVARLARRADTRSGAAAVVAVGRALVHELHPREIVQVPILAGDQEARRDDRRRLAALLQLVCT